MLSWLVHYKNKFPGGMVQASESSIDVYDQNGNHQVALRKSGSGAMICQSEQLGCEGRHDLAPIPKDARLWKIKDGKIAKDELFEERKAKLSQFLDEKGRVKSCAELGLAAFDEKQKLVGALPARELQKVDDISGVELK
jgi:hypothetical protein